MEGKHKPPPVTAIRVAVHKQIRCKSKTMCLDSYLEDYRQEQFDIVTRPRAHRQCFGWLCRRGGMRLRAYCLDGGGGRAGCGNGCWQSVRRGVYGRTRTAAPLGPPWQ